MSKKTATKRAKTSDRDVVVLDTSVVLFDAESIFGFAGYDIIIPLVVLDEVDKFRSLDSEVGRNARRFIRLLKELTNGESKRSLNNGVQRLDTGEQLFVRFVYDRGPFDRSIHIDLRHNDDVILAVCLELKQEPGSSRTVFLSTKDISLSVKANVLGVDTIEYRNDAGIRDVSQLYTGITTIDEDDIFIDELYTNNGVAAPDMDLFENSGVILKSPSNKSALGLYKNGYILKLRNNKPISNITPKTAEQEIAAELILDPSVELLTLTGPAGTGKTLLTIAGGIQTAINSDAYDRIVVSRPIQPLGKDIGYLPGDIYDKMAPWVGPIRDAVEVVLGDNSRFDDLVAFGKIGIEPLTYIRGRSIPRTFFILDEGQNITQHEMKAIISRMGQGSKIVLTGDIMQIDNHYLDPVTNGLTVVVEKFKHSHLAGHVTLTKGQRSELATLAAELL